MLFPDIVLPPPSSPRGSTWMSDSDLIREITFDPFFFFLSKLLTEIGTLMIISDMSLECTRNRTG